MDKEKQIIIDGLGGTLDVFGLFVTDASSFPEAMPKESIISIPGGGTIDLSESITGDVVFADIEQTIVLAACEGIDIYESRRKLVNALSGRVFDYRLSWDPSYFLRGRWRFGDVKYLDRRHAVFTVKTRTEPWRSKGDQIFRVNAAGGIVITLNSGRMPVCPTFEFASETIVSAGDIHATMQPGTYKITDLWLQEGTNELYLNSYLGEGNIAAERYLDDTTGSHSNDRISDLIWEGIRGAASLVADWQHDTVSMHAEDRIIDSVYAVDTDTERFAVYINYPWKDL